MKTFILVVYIVALSLATGFMVCGDKLDAIFILCYAILFRTFSMEENNKSKD